MTHVAQQREQEEERGALVSPAHHAGHRLRVDRVRGEEQAGQQAPRSLAEQQAGQQGEEAAHGAVRGHVDQVVAPRVQAARCVVEAEGQRAEGPVGLVAAAVSEQGAPEVVVEDVDPGRLRQQVLVGLDRAAAGRRRDEAMRKTNIRRKVEGGCSFCAMSLLRRFRHRLLLLKAFCLPAVRMQRRGENKKCRLSVHEI